MVSILHIGCPFSPHKGGSVVRFTQLNESLEDVKVGLITPTKALNEGCPPEEISPQGFHIYRFDPAKMANAKSIRQVMRSFKPDVVVIHNNRVLLCWVLLVMCFVRVKVLYEVHSLRDDGVLKRLLAILLYKFIDGFIVLSKKTAEILADEYYVKQPMSVVYNGFNDANQQPKVHQNQRTTDINFAYIGSFHDWQGVAVIAEAYLQLTDIVKAKIKLHFVGDGPLFNAVKQQLKADELLGRVIFHGWIAQGEALALTRTCDVILMPRLSTRGTETVIPLKVVEAGNMGKCVIASDVGGLQEGLGGQALWVKAGDATSLAQAIIVAIENPEKRTELGCKLQTFSTLYPTWQQSAATMKQFMTEHLG